MKNKSNIALFIGTLALLCLISVILSPIMVGASLPLFFSPPSQITLTMHVLNSDGSVAFGRPLCQLNDNRFGCTFNSSKLYPFSSSNITIGIEGHTVNNVQQGYLHNVVPQELGPSHAASSVRAQAIAARTYAYWQIQTYGTMNNSTERQAYIPYRYDDLPSWGKTIIDQAVAGNPYMSLPNDSGNNPIAAFFTSDNDLWTAQSTTYGYLKSIYDPISGTEGHDIGHQLGGMGQMAAGRWGAGRTNEYPNGGSRWSVRWDTPEQILAHYYTGISFINLNSNLSNDYRLNILDVEGLPEQLTLSPGESAPPRNVVMQNTGPFNWNVLWASSGSSACQSGNPPTRLSYHLYTSDNSTLACRAGQGVNSPCFGIERYALCRSDSNLVESGVTLGVPNVRIRIPSEVPPGTYNLRFDLEVVGTEWASGLPYANHWPTQDIQIIVEDPGGTGGEEPSANINHPPAVFTTEDWLNNGQRFGLSWVPVNGANYFDFRYRSREFFSALDWDDVGWTAQLNNIPYTSVYDDNITCYNNKDRREYQFQVRGQIGSSGDEGPWKTTYSNLRIFPFLSINNVAYGYAVFFELDSPTTTHNGNLYVTNAGGGTLQWQATDNRSWIDLSSTAGTNDGTVTLTITKPGGLGIYNGQITFTVTDSDPAACNSQITIPVTVFVLEQVEKMYFPIILKNANP